MTTAGHSATAQWQRQRNGTSEMCTDAMHQSACNFQQPNASQQCGSVEQCNPAAAALTSEDQPPAIRQLCQRLVTEQPCHQCKTCSSSKSNDAHCTMHQMQHWRCCSAHTCLEAEILEAGEEAAQVRWCHLCLLQNDRLLHDAHAKTNDHIRHAQLLDVP